jgi:hypothetical protein
VVRIRTTFYVDRVPSQPLKGRGWIDISDIEIAKRLNISLTGEHNNSQVRFKVYEGEPEYELVNRQEYFYRNGHLAHLGKPQVACPQISGISVVGIRGQKGVLWVTVSCNRGKAGGKKFTVVDRRETVRLIVQKTLTIEAVCAWVKTWASERTEIITPGGKTISLDGDNLATTEYVYFIHSEESNAVKIGRAKDVEKRLKSLQTAHPHELKVIKIFKLKGGKAAQELESSLHQKFDHLRLSGEWFKAEPELLDYR